MNSRIPKTSLTVTTYEFDGREWTAAVTHVFHGDSREEVLAILEAHKKTDAFFAGSFTGNFRGIRLKNSEQKLTPEEIEVAGVKFRLAN